MKPTKLGHITTANQETALESRQPIRSVHLLTFFFPTLSSFSSPQLSLCWWNSLTERENVPAPPSPPHPQPPPSYVCSGAAEKLWLTPGRNPVAATIYREGTESHLHLELMRDWSAEGEREDAWRIQSISKINKLLLQQPMWFSSRTNKEWTRERGGETAEDNIQIPPFFTHKVKKKYPQIWETDPNWI